MKTYKMSLLDYAFFLTETRENPKHVGLLSIFSKPQDADKDYLKALYERWMAHGEVNEPFNLNRSPKSI